jgi:uncharacterized protein
MGDPALAEVRDSPGFKVLVDGQALPDEAHLDILEVGVADHVEGADMFTLRFNNWDSGKQELKWSERDLLREGVEIEVRIGYVDALASAVVGEVTALEPEFHAGEAPSLTVRGYDRLHRFRRGKKTRTFTNVKDSEVAEQIARDLQLKAEVDDSQVVHDYLLQNNRTDVDFLRERARRIRFELRVEDKTLFFRKAANDRGKVVTLEYGFSLQCFYPRLNTLRQVSEVAVQGWSPKTREALSGTARAGDETTTMGGATLGARLAERAFFAAAEAVVDRPVASAGEASQMAKARFNDLAMEFVTGEGKATGDPGIRAGSVVELAGLGKRFSGLYYVCSSDHRVGAAGYTTDFTVARDAV